MWKDWVIKQVCTLALWTLKPPWGCHRPRDRSICSVLVHMAARSRWLAPYQTGFQGGPGREVEGTKEDAFYKGSDHASFWVTVENVRLASTTTVSVTRVWYVVDNVDHPWKCSKINMTQAVARILIWLTWKKGLYEWANDVFFFRHQLKVKIRCMGNSLDRITFHKMWVYAEDWSYERK